MPAAAPAATRESYLFKLLSAKVPTPLAIDAPISTLGPSGPKEFPVPIVTQAAIVLRKGRYATLRPSKTEMGNPVPSKRSPFQRSMEVRRGSHQVGDGTKLGIETKIRIGT